MTSIDFRSVSKFDSPFFSTQKSNRRAVREGVVTATVMLFIEKRDRWTFLVVGLSDGKILYWETDRYAVEKRGKDSKPRVLDEHKGSVTCMSYVASLCQGVMLTGSADRCIKMWDLSDPRLHITCVHSLYGHGGTVLALEFGSELLCSSSTDGFLCVWRDQSPAKILRFPSYSIKQKISPDPKAASLGAQRAPKESWFLSLSIREGESPSVFAGDSDGYVHIYKPEALQGASERDQIFLLAWKGKIHEFGICKIMTLPMESFVFTLSHDQRFKTLDSLSGSIIFEESNPCNTVFRGLAWDSTSQDVMVGDDKGNVGIYNLYMESCVAWRSLTQEPILQLHYEQGTRRLIVLTEHLVEVFDVMRGLKFAELMEHTEPVVAMVSRPTPQGGLLYTAAMDNTIRMWDAEGLECIKCLKERKDEITAMVYLPRANVVVTGHEPGDLKIWSVDSQQDACLRTVSGQAVHENTISALIWVASSSEEAPSPPPPPPSSTAAAAGGEEEDVGFETLVAGSYDRQLSFWKVTLTSDGTAMAKFERAFVAHQEIDDEILAVAYSSAGQAIFTGGNHGIIRKWSLWGGGPLPEDQLEGHADAVVCFAVDGHFLFSGSVDASVRIWETTQGMLLKEVRVHKVTVQALLVLPESGTVVSCAFDGRIVFWDPCVAQKDGVKELQVYDQPEEFRALAFVELNRTLLAGAESGKIIGFPLPSDDGVAQPGTQTPKLLSGVETPPSSREGEGISILEMLRSRPD